MEDGDGKGDGEKDGYGEEMEMEMEKERNVHCTECKICILASLYWQIDKPCVIKGRSRNSLLE
jgi:hypothetical protein